MYLLAVLLIGCGGAGPEPEEPAGGRRGGAQIAGPVGSGKPRIAGGSASLDEALYQLARHAADIVGVMRDHMNDCDRAARVCNAYVEHNRASIDRAKARIATEVETRSPGSDVEDVVANDLQRLLLEMEPNVERIADEFEDRCPGVADEVGEALEF
jgi:hypothetical protein